MTAKEYLNQIREKDTAINRMIRQKENLEGMLYTIGSPGTGERVQSSKSGSSRYEELLAKISEKENEINNTIDDLVDLKLKLCGQINELPDEVYITILYERYIKLKSWHQIADSMEYSVKYLFRVHGAALNEFYRMYAQEINTTK